MASMNLQLKKFDPSKMADDAVSVFIAKRRSGKSVLMKDVMYHKRHALSAGIVLSGTEEGNGWYSNPKTGFVPNLFVYNDMDLEAIERLIDRQRKLVKAGRPNSNCFLIMDDCMHDPKTLKSPIIRQVFLNGRHWKIFTMIAAQYAMDMGPSLRANIDYCFILRENIVANREKLWKQFFGIFPTLDAFSRTMDVCTENYECLVLDNTVKSNKIEDCVFWYRARCPTPKFRMGSPQFWGAHNKLYNKDHEKRLDQSKVKRNTHLTVTKRK